MGKIWRKIWSLTCWIPISLCRACDFTVGGLAGYPSIVLRASNRSTYMRASCALRAVSIAIGRKPELSAAGRAHGVLPAAQKMPPLVRLAQDGQREGSAWRCYCRRGRLSGQIVANWHHEDPEVDLISMVGAVQSHRILRKNEPLKIDALERAISRPRVTSQGFVVGTVGVVVANGGKMAAVMGLSLCFVCGFFWQFCACPSLALIGARTMRTAGRSDPVPPLQQRNA